MRLTLSEIDEQIREVENRIAVERIALEDAISGCTASMKELVTSPKTLLTLAGVGFAVGSIVFRGGGAPSQSTPAKKAGLAALLTGAAGTALSFAGSRWGSIATWAARKYFARHRAKAAAAAPPPPPSPSPSPTGGVR